MNNTPIIDILSQTKEFSAKEKRALSSYIRRLDDKGVPIIFDQKHLSLILNINHSFLSAVCNSPVHFYKTYQIPKRSGGYRVLEEPYPDLKNIQTWILKNILEPASKYYVSPVAKAFIPGKNLRANARFHKQKKIVIALDLKDFFGSIHFGPIYGIFKKIGYTKSTCVMLSKLCLCNDSLPQGAPTSPMLSNMVFYDLDTRIFDYCKRRGIMYTRYADDMVFSGNNIDISHIISYVRMLVSHRDFRLNEDKTRVMGRGTRQMVTGIVVNDKIQVPRKYREHIRQEVYYLIKYGLNDHFFRMKNKPFHITTPQAYARHLYGKINFVLQINPTDETFKFYKNWTRSLLNSMK